jgi:hypothetical protein
MDGHAESEVTQTAFVTDLAGVHITNTDNHFNSD